MTIFRNAFRLLKHKNSIIIALIILLIIVMRGCYNNRVAIRENNDAWRQLEKQKTDSLQKVINEKGEEIATQEQLIITEKQAKEMALLENERLKKIKSKTKVITRTQIRDVFIPYDTTIYIHDTLLDSSYAAKSFLSQDEWYSVKGSVLINGVKLDHVSFRNELEHTIGYQPEKGIKRLWTQPTPVVEIVNKNPYSTTESMQNFVIKPQKKKFYQTKGFAFGVGILGGFLLFK